MSAVLNPAFRKSARLQGRMYYARRRRRGQALIGALTPWAEGLNVTKGQYVQSAGNAYQAANNGTSGGIQPVVGAGSVSDGATGGVTWQYVEPQTFERWPFDTAIATPA